MQRSDGEAIFPFANAEGLSILDIRDIAYHYPTRVETRSVLVHLGVRTQLEEVGKPTSVVVVPMGEEACRHDCRLRLQSG